MPVGKEFVYSCLNYITLAHIVHKVSGKTLDEFAAENIFKPLGMTRTFYRPPANLIDQCVPTEVIDGKPLRGVVHDPLARLQGGVSGNAGLFSTADDLAVFAQMMLDRGDAQRRPHPQPAHRRAHDRDLPQGRRSRAGASAGTSIRTTRPSAATSSVPGPTATRATPAPRSGSTRKPGRPSSS